MLVVAWSGWDPKDVYTWILEVAPIFIGTLILLRLYSYFRFSRLVAWLLWVHAIILAVGGHYTYAEVPLGNWVRDAFHLSRNHYDRFGHFAQGFVPAMVVREVYKRRAIVRGDSWLFFIVVCTCLAISAAYELIEWAAAVWTGGRAEAFLGTQGDVWDTQKDMALAGLGAVIAQWVLTKRHDASMAKLFSK